MYRTSRFNRFPTLGALVSSAALLICAGLASAQSEDTDSEVASYLAPVGEVCLANEPCVGRRAGEAMDPAAGGQPAATPGPSTAVAAQSAPADQAPAAGAGEFDPAAVYQRNCMACHTTGAAGAPQLGDQDAWDTRVEKGMDAVMQNVINGIGAMPARGLCMDCSDEQLRAIVDYIISQ